MTLKEFRKFRHDSVAQVIIWMAAVGSWLGSLMTAFIGGGYVLLGLAMVAVSFTRSIWSATYRD